MANRHANKKRRQHVHERMAATGESYQTALEALRRSPTQPVATQRPSAARPSTDGWPAAKVDLLEARYFGAPITLAVFEVAPHLGRPLILHVPSSRAWQPGAPAPTPLAAFRRMGWQ